MRLVAADDWRPSSMTERRLLELEREGLLRPRTSSSRPEWIAPTADHREVVSHGFFTDISKSDAENEERLHALIDDAEVPGERLAKLFEPEVLPLETSSGADEGGEG